MKTKLLTLALVSAFAFTACSDDDDSGSGSTGGTNNQTTAQKIANVWTGDELDVTASLVLPPTTLIDTTVDYSFATIDFNANGNVTIDSLGTTISSGTWALTPSDDLILALDGFIDTVEILTITSTQFQYRSSDILPSPFGDIMAVSTTKLVR